MRPSLLTFAISLSALAQPPTFEEASVKPAVIPNGPVYFGPTLRRSPAPPDPSQITWSYARLIDMLMTAYDMKEFPDHRSPPLDLQRAIQRHRQGPRKSHQRASPLRASQTLLADRFGGVLNTMSPRNFKWRNSKSPRRPQAEGHHRPIPTPMALLKWTTAFRGRRLRHHDPHGRKRSQRPHLSPGRRIFPA